MAEFASKGVAGSGLVLVSQVRLLVSLNNGGNGLLSGLLGGSNQNMISTLQAENSLLKTILIRMLRKSTHSLLQTAVDSVTKPLADEGRKQLC